MSVWNGLLPVYFIEFPIFWLWTCFILLCGQKQFNYKIERILKHRYFLSLAVASIEMKAASGSRLIIYYKLFLLKAILKGLRTLVSIVYTILWVNCYFYCACSRRRTHNRNAVFSTMASQVHAVRLDRLVSSSLQIQIDPQVLFAYEIRFCP